MLPLRCGMGRGMGRGTCLCPGPEQEHEWGNTTFDHFFDAMEAASGDVLLARPACPVSLPAQSS